MTGAAAADRRRFRLQLLIAFLALLTVGYARQFLVSPTTGQDFRTYYAGAAVLRAGGNPYDWSMLGAMETALYNAPNHRQPDDPRFFDFQPETVGPWLLLALAPLTRWPPEVAEAIWSAALLALLIGGAWLILTWLGWQGTTRRLGLLVVTLSPIVFINIFLGQATPSVFAAFAGALALAAAGRPRAAGLLLTAAWIKPNIGLVLPVVLMLGYPRAWPRMLTGFGIGTLAAFAVGWWSLGTALLAWPKGILQLWLSVQSRQPDIASLPSFYYPMLAGWSKTAALAAATTAIAVYAVIALRRSGAPTVKALTLLLAWFCAVPYVHSFDTILLLPAIAFLAGPALRGLDDPWLEATIWAFAVLPLVYFTGLHLGPFNGFSAVPVALLAWAWHRRKAAVPRAALPVAA